MQVGDWIDIPIFIGTKGGGKKRVGTGDGQVLHIGPKFITVWNGKYNQTFTHAELQAKPEEVVD